MFVFAIDINLRKLWEGDVESKDTSAMDFFVTSWGLREELVAGEVKDYKTLFLILTI